MLIFLLVLLVLVLLILCVSYALFYIGVCRYPKERPVKLARSLTPYLGQIEEGISWFKAQSPERVEISAYDSTPLVGLYLHHPEAKGTIILMHGFRSDAYHDFSCAFRFYYEQGYSLLSVFQRAHGESGGSCICYGVKERYDCRDWARYVCDRFGPEHDIFLGGISMGASTVLMATGLEMPKSVRGVIADCGFTSPYDEFKAVLKDRFRLPEHPFMDVADLFSRAIAGFGFKDYSTLSAMELNTLPILFVHGESDRFVPTGFTLENYKACKAEKELITVPGAGHGMSYLLDTPGCQKVLSAFLAKHSTCTAPEISGNVEGPEAAGTGKSSEE
jgi:hypothetical protein